MHNCASRYDSPPGTVVRPPRYFRIEKIDIETDVQVSLRVHVLQGQLHGLPHAHFVNEAHIEHLELLFVHERLSPVSTLRMPTCRTTSPRSPASRRRFAAARGTESAQARQRHPVQTSARREFPRIEIGMRVQPQQPQGLAHVAAMAGDCGNGSDAQTMIASSKIGRRCASTLRYTASCTHDSRR